MSVVKWRKLPRYCAFLAATWISLWLILEIFLGVFGYGDYVIYQPDPELLWIPAPNQVGKTVAGHQTITINNQSLRYLQDTPPQKGQRYRIVAFGDSVTMGWGVDDNSHYCARLEELMKAQSGMRSPSVISAGVNAYPISLCVRRFEKMIENGFQIDIAILAYSFNTAHEQLARLDGTDREQFLRNVRAKSVLRRSAVYNLLIEDWLRDLVYYRIRQKLVAGSWEMEEDPDHRNLDFYAADLSRMRDVCLEKDIDLLFILLASKGQSEAELSENQRAFLAFANDYGIEIVDMVDRFSPLDPDSLFMDHVHPTPEGHQVIAESIVPLIKFE